MNRLISISTELAQLNETLRSELDGSRRNSQELQSMLETSKKELEGLRSELENLRSDSTALLSGAENSNTELSALRQALMTAETSLESLERSFSAYKQAAERKIQNLEKTQTFWKTGFFAACGLALGLGITILVIAK